MDDTAQMPTNSYVNTYVPPSTTTPSAEQTSQLSSSPQPVDPQAAPQASYQPPAMPAANDNMMPQPGQGQTLEEQNIFDLLGVSQAKDEEKESFLDELQQVIWEDFIENDVELLLTESEVAELQTIQAKSYPSDLEKQEAIVVFLEKLIPDLEDVMLEKALELKREMVMERIKGMKEYFAAQPAKATEVTKAEGLIADNKWREAANVLNALAE